MQFESAQILFDVLLYFVRNRFEKSLHYEQTYKNKSFLAGINLKDSAIEVETFLRREGFKVETDITKREKDLILSIDVKRPRRAGIKDV